MKKIMPILYLIMALWLFKCSFTKFVSSQCLDDQKSLLLELKKELELEFNPFDYTIDESVEWNPSTDCCQWSGVECHNLRGQVIGLDISNFWINSWIDNNSSLFRLKHLQSLNLAANWNIRFQGNVYIPSTIGKLSNLTYLKLSKLGLEGQVPIEISHLHKLRFLDISSTSLKLERPSLETLLKTLTNMRQLYLNGVDNSAIGTKWCQALSLLPHLRVLSMSGCNLKGRIHNSLSNLQHLSIIDLSANYLEGPVPEFLTGFTNLTSLILGSSLLTKLESEKIFHIPTLKTLDLSGNPLQGTLPVFYNGSMEELLLGGTQFSGHLPSSISNLKSLRKIDISDCQFHGSIPSSMASLNLLEYVDLSDNHFSGPIPSFSLAEKLSTLYLSGNNLTGSINATAWEKLVHLGFIDLSNNLLDGNIPMALFSLPSVYSMCLVENKFSGQLHEFSTTYSEISVINLNNNNLEGPVPKSFSRLRGLTDLQLYSNRFNGTLKLAEFLHNFQSYSSILDLSYNLLSVDTDGCGVNSSIPQFLLAELRLSSCNLTIFPEFLKTQKELYAIDFSNNHIQGPIPRWICNSTSLQLLNLENNHFNQNIPDCLFAMTQLTVLSLRGNNIGGVIPSISGINGSLETLDLNGNFLQGQIPLSLGSCKALKVLDLGFNQLSDTFPCHLESLPKLRLLILRSNKFHGTIVCQKNHSIWPQLRIIDLASNHFSGELTSHIFLKLRSMMNGTIDVQSNLDDLSHLTPATDDFYHDVVALTLKGFTYQPQSNLVLYNTIDFSNNAFHGNLPKELGNLNSLVVLSLSHNYLSGYIPSSFGNLSLIESLDLSCNALSGKIPPQFAKLNFLEYLNVSFNKLSGKIPTSTQLQSFDASSYEGNQGLYGPPLTQMSPSKPDIGEPSSTYTQELNWSSKNTIEWGLRGAQVGFPVGITILIGPLLYVKRWKESYCKFLHRVVKKIMRKEENARGMRRHRGRDN